MITDAELEELRRRWNAAMEHPMQVQLLTPLPRKAQLRLGVEQAITRTGTWLGDHVSWSVADRFWRITGKLL